MTDLINAKRVGKTIKAKARPSGENVIDLMDALKRSLSGGSAKVAPQSKTKAKRGKKVAPGQKEMLLPIAGTGAGKETTKAPAKSGTARKRKTA